MAMTSKQKSAKALVESFYNDLWNRADPEVAHMGAVLCWRHFA